MSDTSYINIGLYLILLGSIMFNQSYRAKCKKWSVFFVTVIVYGIVLICVSIPCKAKATELSYTPYVYHTSITYRSELNEKVNMIGIEHNNVIATVFTNSFNDRGYGLGLKLPLPDHPGKTKIDAYIMGLFGYKDSLIKPYAQLSFKRHFRNGIGGSLNWGTGLVSMSLLYKF